MNLRSLINKFVPYHKDTRTKEAKLFSMVPINANVLDVGCGDGTFISSLSTVRAVGIDIDKVKIAKAKNAKTYERVYMWDARVPLLKEKKFGTVICNSVLEHIPNVELAVKELSKIGDTVIVTVPQVRNPILIKLSYVLFNHKNLFSKEMWIGMFEKYGMKAKLVEEYNDNRINTLYIISCVFIPFMLIGGIFVRILNRLPSKEYASVFIVFGW